MNSNKIKKKNIKLSGVKIETEKDDIYPMAHYIDDRVELVKQIFLALKPKTIKSLAPEFLGDTPIEEIEELCLKELLGISTKRLTSIINSTKCPTDTESDNSDVNHVEEHISLEEISSESESERTHPKRIGKKTQKKDATLTQNENQDENGKEYSVLELLELQARARAIRSQLALEPIAKIEVDSDDTSETENSSADKSATKKLDVETNKVYNKDANKSSTSKDKEKQSSVAPAANGSSKKSRQMVKIKRNFRKRVSEDSENDGDTNSNISKEQNETTSKVPKMEDEPRDVKGTVERSPSPDVITILPSPETLCISDSGEDEPENSKVASEENSNLITNEENSSNQKSQDEKRINETTSNAEENKGSDIEDGEITDKDESKSSSQLDTSANSDLDPQKQDESIYNNESEGNQENYKQNKKMQSSTDTEKNFEETIAEKDAPLSTSNRKADICEFLPEGKPKKNESSDNENLESNEYHVNDDVISLGNDDLDYEMREPEEERKTKEQKPPVIQQKTRNKEKKKSENVASTSKDNKQYIKEESQEIMDYIELHDSTDEDLEKDHHKTDGHRTPSWNFRWLNSSKVTKILATSRLGNRVREKVKKLKKIEKPAVRVDSESESSSAVSSSAFATQVEEGSVQQYKEILDGERANK